MGFSGPGKNDQRQVQGDQGQHDREERLGDTAGEDDGGSMRCSIDDEVAVHGGHPGASALRAGKCQHMTRAGPAQNGYRSATLLGAKPHDHPSLNPVDAELHRRPGGLAAPTVDDGAVDKHAVANEPTPAAPPTQHHENKRDPCEHESRACRGEDNGRLGRRRRSWREEQQHEEDRYRAGDPADEKPQDCPADQIRNRSGVTRDALASRRAAGHRFGADGEQIAVGHSFLPRARESRRLATLTALRRRKDIFGSGLKRHRMARAEPTAVRDPAVSPRPSAAKERCTRRL